MQFENDCFMVAWNRWPESDGAVEVGPWPDRQRWSERYMSTSGCCDTRFHDLTEDERAQVLLNLAAHLMFDGIAPADVLREFAKIPLWRDMSVNLLFPGPVEVDETYMGGRERNKHSKDKQRLGRRALGKTVVAGARRSPCLGSRRALSARRPRDLLCREAGGPDDPRSEDSRAEAEGNSAAKLNPYEVMR